MQLYIWQKCWNKEGKALGVIVMQMAEQQDDLGYLPAGQLTTQGNHACSCVEHDRPPPKFKLHAGCVAANSDRALPGGGITPAHAPEFDSQIIRHSAPL